MLSGIGGFGHRDGVSTGGYPFDPKAIAPNVEFNEQAFPILYLYRRELEDSAGPGRFRGGAAAAWAFVPHGTDQIQLATAASGQWVPTGTGSWGGGVGTTVQYEIRSDSDVRRQFERRRVPQDFDEVEGTRRELAPKVTGVVQGPDDALAMRYPGAGGWGDPIERDPAAVGTDVEEGYVSVSGAERHYGVVVGLENGIATVDEAATQARREHEVEARRAGAGEPTETAPELATSGSGTVTLADTVKVVFDDGATVFSCLACEHQLGRDLAGYKWGAVRRERSLTEAVPRFVAGELDQELVQREHYCPGCMRLLDAEVVRAGEDSLLDVEIWSPPQQS